MTAEALALGVAGAAILFLLTVIVGVLGWMVRSAFADIKELRARVELAATRAELATAVAALQSLALELGAIRTAIARFETKLDMLNNTR